MYVQACLLHILKGKKKPLPSVIYIEPDIVKILHILPYLNFTPNPVSYY